MLAKYHVVRQTTLIGDMYEGLTQEVFEKVMIRNLDLRVASGKVRLPDGSFSSQIDCMVVVGEGDRLPRTKNYIYEKENVIAVIEVKKNLFTNEMDDAFRRLNSIMSELPDAMESYQHEMIFEAFSSVLYGVKRKRNMAEYTPMQLNTYYSLMANVLNPLKIVFAYDGINSVEGLKKSILKLVEKNVGKEGFLPCNFPDLVICGKIAMVKMNSLPFATPVTPHGIWPFYCSRKENPLTLLIEIIWYRLMKRFNLGYDVFEHQLITESFDIILGGRYEETPERQGWMLHDFPAHWTTKDFYVNPEGPLELTELEYATLIRLLSEKKINCYTDSVLNEGLQENLILVGAFVQHLVNMGIFETNGRDISLTKVQHVFFRTVDGGFFAAEANKEYLKDWMIP